MATGSEEIDLEEILGVTEFDDEETVVVARSVEPFERCIMDPVAATYRPSFPFTTDRGGVKVTYHTLEAFVVAPNQEQTPDHEAVSYTNLQAKQAEICEIQWAVGRLFSEPGPGSAFQVSPTTIASAHHILKDAGLVFVNHMVAGSIASSTAGHTGGVVARMVSDEERMVYLQSDLAIPINDADPGSITIRRNPGIQIDVNFGLLSNPAPADCYLVPFAGPIVPKMPIVVLGYPGAPPKVHLPKGTPSEEIIKAHQTSYYGQHNISPSKFEKTFGFSLNGVKHVSCGMIRDINTRLVTHTATTAPGVSGGPVIPLEDPTTFVAIHIEGWSDSNYNLAVSVTHPHFITMYAKHVAPQFNPLPPKVISYLQAHSALLRTIPGLAPSVISVL